MNTHIFSEFNQRIFGEVVVPESEAYTQLSNVFNQVGSPAAIVRVQTNQDIVETLRFAREHQFTLPVRSGGHGFSRLATNTGGLVLDVKVH